MIIHNLSVVFRFVDSFVVVKRREYDESLMIYKNESSHPHSEVRIHSFLNKFGKDVKTRGTAYYIL